MNKKIFIGFLTAIIIMIGAGTCFAEDETGETTKEQIDFTEAKYEVKTDTSNATMLSKVKITGIKNIKDEKNNVYYLLTNDDNKTITSSEGKELIIADDGSAEIAISKSTDLYLYVWIMRDNKVVTVKEAYKIERTIPDLTKRISGLFLKRVNKDTYISTNLLLGGLDDITKVKCKIGAVTDTSLLKEIKNDAGTGVKKLLEYAKSDTGIKQTTINATGNTDISLSDLGLKDNKYYYVYFSIENSGKYLEVEDVNLYQATVTEGDYMLHRMEQSTFKWNLTEETKSEETKEEKKDETVSDKKLPNTGKTIVFGTIAIMGIIALTAKYNDNKYKNI